MRILHLAWEYPPLVYGGIAPHVSQLAAAQAADGHDVVVVTQSHPQAPADSVVDGVRVVRVSHHPPQMQFGEETLLAWVAALNNAMSAALVRLPGPQVVHAHDWVTAYSAAVAADGLGLPLVVTFHSTERGRHQGHLPSPLARAIDGVETWLASLARAAIACSSAMAQDLASQFGVRAAVIPNGVDAPSWQVDRHPQPQPLLLFAGRLEWEKGTFDLIDAMPALRRRLPGVRLVLAGHGRQAEALRDRARAKRLGRSVSFPGHLTRDEIIDHFARASAVIVPSRYEPFGIIALEAAAAGVPLVLARTGGLMEIGADGANAAMFDPGDVPGLVAAVTRTVTDAGGQRTAAAAEALGSRFAWPVIARRTVEVYDTVASDGGR